MDTKTYEDWSKYVGLKPDNFGVIARFYKNYTLNYLLDGLLNVYFNNEKTSKYQVADSLVIEWSIETNQIKHIEFADVPSELGESGSEILMAFKENYYLKYDIFRIDGSEQQCLVMSHPVRKNDNYWEVLVRLIANNYDTILDVDACQVGMTTTFLSTANVELSEEGYSKFLSSFEKHRNYLTNFRCDISWSSLYALQENVFLRICSDKDKNAGQEVYKMVKKEKELLDTFMYVTNTGLLMNKGNVDVNGRATIQDPKLCEYWDQAA